MSKAAFIIAVLCTTSLFGLERIVLTNKSNYPYLFDVAITPDRMRFNPNKKSLNINEKFTIHLRDGDWLGQYFGYPPYLWLGSSAAATQGLFYQPGQLSQPGYDGDLYAIDPLKYKKEMYLYIDKHEHLYEWNTWRYVPVPKNNEEAKKFNYTGGVLYLGHYRHQR